MSTTQKNSFGEFKGGACFATMRISFHMYSRQSKAISNDETLANLNTGSKKKWWLALDKPIQNIQFKAVDFIKSGKTVNANVINSILSIYNLHVTDESLNDLINTPVIIFNDLHKDLNKDSVFKDKLGEAYGKAVAGVYIFTHKETGAKYVGSSVQLATRLSGYLKKSYKVYGKFLPFLTSEGLDKFTLTIMPLYSSPVLKPELILEQYFLLDPSFNLNLSRVANVPNFNNKEMYMYNSDKTILIYHSSSIKDFLVKFGIWYKAILNNLETGTYYLGKYAFSSVPILTAKPAEYSDEDIKKMLAKDRKSTILYMYNVDKTILYFSGINKDFSSLGIYLSNFKHLIDSDTFYLDKYVLTTSVISDADISDMSEAELVEQLDKDRRDLKVSTGKAIGVALLETKTNKKLTFKSLSLCAKYLESIGLKSTTHTLKSRILSGKDLKGYLVSWDKDQTFIHAKANPISITNEETGEVSIYNSVREAERTTGIWGETLKKYAHVGGSYKGLIIAFI